MLKYMLALVVAGGSGASLIHFRNGERERNSKDAL
jgi:hypothetical protein